jgi:hypothetical protein
MHKALALAVLLLSLCATPLAAQSPRSERPYRGLFGGSGGEGDTSQSLTARGNLGVGYDDSLLAASRGNSRPRPDDLNTPLSGGLSQFSGSLTYTLAFTGLSIDALAGTTARYYPSIEREIVSRNHLRTAASVSLPAGFSVSGMVEYRPQSLASLFPSISGVGLDGEGTDEAPVDSAFVTSSDHLLAYQGALNFSRDLSARLKFAADYSYRRREELADIGGYRRTSGGGQLSYRMSQSLTLRAGYHLSEAHYTASDLTTQRHLIDTGVDYHKSLSFSRRTTLGFGTGLTAVTEPSADGRASQDTRFRATGSAILNHEIGRSWTAAVIYARGAHFREDWPVPVFSDAVTATLGGLVTRRVQVQLSARSSAGRAGFSANDNGFSGSYATAVATFGMTHNTALGVQYLYYRHHFDRADLVLPGYPDSLDRHSVRAYVSVWAALFQRARKSDASR